MWLYLLGCGSAGSGLSGAAPWPWGGPEHIVSKADPILRSMELMQLMQRSIQDKFKLQTICTYQVQHPD